MAFGGRHDVLIILKFKIGLKGGSHGFGLAPSSASIPANPYITGLGCPQVHVVYKAPYPFQANKLYSPISKIHFRHPAGQKRDPQQPALRESACKPENSKCCSVDILPFSLLLRRAKESKPFL